MLFVRDFLADQTVLRAPPPAAAPAVSVILPTYRRRASGLLERALTSVLNQTFEDFELLVMDDGSNDGSAELIEQYRARDPRVIHVRHERNCGLPALRVNEGIELARGRYLAFQFDDDCWRPGALQALAAAAEHQSEPAVVVGRARFNGSGSQWSLPRAEVSLVSLYQQNQIANNSVLLPREILDRHGMYDPHIGMRRLCDWDMWLRLIRHAPFVVIDEAVSDIFESNPGAIGLTVPWDLQLFYSFHAIPRASLLTPERWRDYEVDALRVGEVEFDLDTRRRLYEEQIVPFYLSARRHFPTLDSAPLTLPAQTRPKPAIYAKNEYDVSNDVTLGHYDALANRRGSIRAHFVPLPQLGPEWVSDAAALLLVRPVEEAARAALEQAQGAGLPAGVYLDDDLLHFHEYGPQFAYLAPGTPYHHNLSEMLREADAVWATNEFIRASILPLNPRVVPHNNALAGAWLPETIRPRRPDRPVRIGYAGSGYRVEEFAQIWDGLARVAQEHGERVQFEFWGVDVSGLPPLGAPVTQRPFTFSYFHYLHRLQQAEFDILLAPLLDQPAPRLGKSLIKYYETAAAGALGIFSDVPQYASLPAGRTCLKAANTPEAWQAALQRALALPADEFDEMRRRAAQHVREEYTETAQIHLHEAAWRATEFHARTRAQRAEDGRPRVAYVLHSAHFGGGEIQLWRRLRLARQYAIEPIVVLPRVLEHTEAAERLRQNLGREQIQVEFVEYTCFTEPRAPSDFDSELERRQVRHMLNRCAPALVHSVTFVPSFGQVCQEMGIPHVASLYAVEDDFGWPDGRPDFTHAQVVQSDSLRYAHRWSELLGAEKFCAREVAPEAVFDLGRTRSWAAAVTPEASPRLVVAGTFQERKSQLEIIEAAGRLKQEGRRFRLDLYGYTHFFPDYVEKCRQRVRAYQLEQQVAFREFTEDTVTILQDADAILSLSTYESFPSTIKEAMAAGVLVVATPVGGIAELIVDGVSGILCADTSVEAMTDGIRRALALSPAERARVVEQARRVARSDFHPQRAANDLLTMYNRALDLSRGGRPAARPGDAPFAAAGVSPAAGRVEAPRGRPASFVPVGRGLTYRLRVQRANWTGCDLLAGTHQRPARGLLRLRIYGEAGPPLREVALDAARIRDNDWLRFRFPPIPHSQGQWFRLELRLAEADAETRLSIFETNPPEAPYRRWLRRAGIPLPGNSPYCRLWYAE